MNTATFANGQPVTSMGRLPVLLNSSEEDLAAKVLAGVEELILQFTHDAQASYSEYPTDVRKARLSMCIDINSRIRADVFELLQRKKRTV